MRRFMFFITVALLQVSTFGQEGSLQIDGEKRDYIVYAPSSGLPENPVLVLALHPLGASNTQFRSMSGWNDKADEEKFVVVYPQGVTTINMGGANLIGWDITGDSDVKFMTDLIDTLYDRYKIDRNRVYSTGFSMGGMLSYILACRVSDKIAAIGPDAGYPVGQNAGSCTPSVPVPVCHVHGADDDFVKYSELPPWIQKFTEVNKCQSSPETTEGDKYIKDDYTPCNDGNDVILYSIKGMGHDYATSSKYGFSATDTFWTFFTEHSRGSATTKMEETVENRRPRLSTMAVYYDGKIRITPDRKINSVRVFDVHGRMIHAFTLPYGQKENCTIPVGRSSGGVCIVKVSGPTGYGVSKVVIR